MPTTTPLQSAYWVSPSKGYALFASNWHAQGTVPRLVLTGGPGTLKNVQPAPPSLFGEYSGYFIEGQAGKETITFFLRARKYPAVDFGKLNVYVVGDFNDWEDAKGNPHWQLRPVCIGGSEGYALQLPKHYCVEEAVVRFKFVTEDGNWLPPETEAPNLVWEGGIANYTINPHQSGTHGFVFDIDERTDPRPITQPYQLTCLGARKKGTPVTIAPGLFFYDIHTNLPLGAHIEEKNAGSETVFRAFAPRATAAWVDVYEDATEDPAARTVKETYTMQAVDGGSAWEARAHGNLHGAYYALRFAGAPGNETDPTTHFNANFPVLDPYALAAVGPLGPGIVFQHSQLPKVSTTERFTPPSWENCVILEGHVRDFIAKADIADNPLTDVERLGFTGLTKYIASEGNYLKSLGINCLELQPIQQFDSLQKTDYHWGYMTNNYFAPCSHYAEDPARASQIEEFATLVKTCHAQGIAVILDVVYNHVGEPAHLLFADKAYYFDLEPTGELSNWSGCGNTLKASAAMAQRLIIESLVHLVETFDIDGFRFDLAELLGLEALGAIKTALKAVKPSILLIAEPWSFRGHIAEQLKHTGWSFWNDGYRETLPKYLKGSADAGALTYYMGGSLAHASRFPAQSINYLESHDDKVFLDTIAENFEHPTENDVRRAHLANAALLLSLGTPMLHSGQDFLRTKHGKHNTYLDGEENALCYAGRLKDFASSHAYTKALIALRLSKWGRALRLSQNPQNLSAYLQTFYAHGSNACALWLNADASEPSAPQLLFAINPGGTPAHINAHPLHNSSWRLAADTFSVDMRGFAQDAFFKANHTIELPPHSCALWVAARTTAPKNALPQAELTCTGQFAGGQATDNKTSAKGLSRFPWWEGIVQTVRRG